MVGLWRRDGLILLRDGLGDPRAGTHGDERRQYGHRDPAPARGPAAGAMSFHPEPYGRGPDGKPAWLFLAGFFLAARAFGTDCDLGATWALGTACQAADARYRCKTVLLAHLCSPTTPQPGLPSLSIIRSY